MLTFETNTLIPLEAFTTFGVNAKPNSNNPIGQFGTGLKYAVAVTLRLGGTFTLYRGNDQYVFYTREADFRGTDVTSIRMKSKKGFSKYWKYTQLPFTLSLGKTWDAWMAVRELESNTRDEQGVSYIGNPSPDSTKTFICIECEDLEQIFDNLTPKVFIDDTKSSVLEYKGIQVLSGSSDYIYYRGIRVTKLDNPSVYTYNILDDFDLTEDRTDKYSFYTKGRIAKLIVANKMLHDTVLTSVDKFESTLDFDDIDTYKSETWFDSIKTIGSSVTLSRAKSAYEKYRAPVAKKYYDIELHIDEITKLLADEVSDSVKQQLNDILES